MPAARAISTPLAACALLCGAFLAAPFWVGRFVPLLDLPQHLALVSVLQHEGDPAWGFDPYFVVEHGELTPYWFYYVALRSLARWMSIETASRVYLSLYVLALPWAGIAFCAALRRPPAAGLLMTPLGLDTNLYSGFVSYSTGVLFLLLGLALVERQLDQPRVWRAVLLAVLAAVLFFTHVQPFAFLLLAAPLLAFTRSGVSRRRLSALLPLIPATAFLFVPWIHQQFLGAREGVPGRYNFGRLGHLGAQFNSFGENVFGFPDAIAGSFQDRSDAWLLAVWAVLVIALIARANASAWRSRLRPALLVGLALIAYFLAPLSITGQWDINPRFAILAVLFAVPLVSGTDRLIFPGALCLSAAVGLNAVREHRAFDREVGPFDRVLEALPPRPRVLALIYDREGKVLSRWPYLHFGQYAMVRKGGVVSNTLAKSPPFPIRHPSPDDFPAPDPWRPEDFRFDRHGAAYEFILVRSRLSAPADSFPAAVPSLELILESGEWALWRRRPLGAAASDRRSPSPRNSNTQRLPSRQRPRQRTATGLHTQHVPAPARLNEHDPVFDVTVQGPFE